LAAVAENSDLQQFAENPKATNAEVFDVVAGVVKAALNDHAKNFLRLVIENGRLNALPEIALQLKRLVNARSGSSDATIFSAFPMDAAAVDQVAQTIEKRFARKLNFSVELQPELIGGIRVVVGDEVLDTSVKSRLEQMKVALTA
jgi:F-type H+-transporting ATPase subunit delta